MRVATHRFSPKRQTVSTVCLFFALIASVATPAWAQSRLNRPPPRYLQLTAPDQQVGAELLRQVRKAGPSGDYYLEFELRVLPRRGDEYRITGNLWGTRNADGPVTRLGLAATRKSDGAQTGEQRLLVQGGPRPSAWQWPGVSGDKAVVIDDATLFTPLAGTDLSAFDLQMPFLYWTDFVYEGTTRLRGRPASTFLLYPPASIAARRPDLTGIRVYLDSQFNALVQAEQIGAEEIVLKSMHVVELKKIGDQWIVKTIELRDETTRNKTRFTVTAAALGLDFAGGLFDPGNLGSLIRPPDKLTRLAGPGAP
jgi:Outer membrane lipoprotein-sorting protein